MSSQVLSICTDKIDIIGDIHGCFYTLETLLKKLGYTKQNGIWRHPYRKTIFVGDYIDRGLNLEPTLWTIKNMVDAGQAIALLGNHEYNIIAINTLNQYGKPYRPQHKIKQHKATLKALSQEQLHFWINWFKKLPIYFETNKIRVAHAYWDNRLIQIINKFLPNQKLEDNIHLALNPNSLLNYALITVLKGPEIDIKYILPPDHPAQKHTGIRILWWKNFDSRPTIKQALGIENINLYVPDHFYQVYHPYPQSEKIFIFGHYSILEKPHILKPNTTTVDFGVFLNNYLCAYRYSGEAQLTENNLVCVPKNNKDKII